MLRVKLRHPVLGVATAVLSAGLLGGSAGAAASTDAAPAAGQPSVSVFAPGLNEPKYMSFGPGGLYVAESGTGGQQCVGLVGVTGVPTRACTGATGSVIRIDPAGRVDTVLRGLASTIEEDNHEISGPIAVTFAGQRLAVLMRGLFNGPTGASSIPGPLGREYGQLVTATPRNANVRLRTLAGIGAFAAANPQPGSTLGGLPGETTYDSDAHDVVPYRGGYAFADAGANDVLWLHSSGQLSLIARLPTLSETAPAGALGPGSPATQVNAQAVASSVATGPGGALYVGILRGLPGLPGSAAVYRVAPGAAPAEVVTGLTRVSDIAFDQQGRMLILESNIGGALAAPATPGALLRATLSTGGPVQAVKLPVSGLVAPTGLAVGPAGAVYVSNQTTTPGQGEILRITGLG